MWRCSLPNRTRRSSSTTTPTTATNESAGQASISNAQVQACLQTVERGDTYWETLESAGIDPRTYPEHAATFNPDLEDPSLIRPGETLQLCTPEPVQDVEVPDRHIPMPEKVTPLPDVPTPIHPNDFEPVPLPISAPASSRPAPGVPRDDHAQVDIFPDFMSSPNYAKSALDACRDVDYLGPVLGPTCGFFSLPVDAVMNPIPGAGRSLRPPDPDVVGGKMRRSFTQKGPAGISKAADNFCSGVGYGLCGSMGDVVGNAVR